MKNIITILSITMALWATGAASAQDPGSKTLQRAVFKVGNISCSGCFSAISDRLSKLDGFSGMGVNLLTKKVAVDFTPPLTPEAVQGTIQALGYPVSLESVDPVKEKESFAYLQTRPGQSAGCCTGRACDLEPRTN
ncbi:MAG: heavy-metal-associated domain-containing protein [Desulfotignum sp.]|nr:heavy-metal-associated domain-containing protein [Desulfotignum sp.]MCF8113958.1 heavy-metal-associated domain-containing protein [Desulfotignum sp.]